MTPSAVAEKESSSKWDVCTGVRVRVKVRARVRARVRVIRAPSRVRAC